MELRNTILHRPENRTWVVRRNIRTTHQSPDRTHSSAPDRTHPSAQKLHFVSPVTCVAPTRDVSEMMIKPLIIRRCTWTPPTIQRGFGEWPGLAELSAEGEMSIPHSARKAEMLAHAGPDVARSISRRASASRSKDALATLGSKARLKASASRRSVKNSISVA